MQTIKTNRYGKRGEAEHVVLISDKPIINPLRRSKKALKSSLGVTGKRLKALIKRERRNNKQLKEGV